MNFFVVVIGMFAVWRITYMLQNEEGPLGVFSRIQAWFASRPDTVGGLQRGFFCFYCLSVWIALPVAFLITTGKLSFLLAWFALSGGAVLIEQVSSVLDKYSRLDQE